MNTNRSAFGIVLSVVGVLAFAGIAQADGFRNPPPGAAGLGRAGAFQAQADDASAISYNPANLVNLDQDEVIFAVSMASMKTKFRNELGIRAESNDPWQALPNIFSAWKMEGGWSAGIGLTTPYGQSSEWDRESVFKYQAPFFARMSLVNINPSAAVRLAENVSLGVGADVFVANLSFKQVYPWAMMIGMPGAPDGTAKFDADGLGVGGNVGLSWDFHPGHRLALTYRSPVTVDFDGKFSVRPAPAFLPNAGRASDFTTEVTFPEIIGLAYGLQVTETVRVEADVEWLGWSRNDALGLDVGANQRLLPARSVRYDWDDSFTYSFSTDWAVTPSWILRAGYTYIESPVPSTTFLPVLPDDKRQEITVGIGWHGGRHAVDVAYVFNLGQEREISGNQTPALNGKYEMSSNLFCLAYRLSF